MAEEKGKVVLFGKRWSSRATVAEMLVSGELKDCSLEPIDSTGECVTSVGRGWTVVDTMGFGEPLGGIVSDEFGRKMAIDFLNEVKGRYSHIIFVVDRADFPLHSDEVMFPIPIMWRTFLEIFKGGEENFVVLVTDETLESRMEFEWLTVQEEGVTVEEKEGLKKKQMRMLKLMKMDRNNQDTRIKKMFCECKHFLFINFGNLDLEKFLKDGHVVSRIEALKRFEKEMEAMFTTTNCPWVELPISKMEDIEIQEMAVKIFHHLTCNLAVKLRHSRSLGSANEQMALARKCVQSAKQQLQRQARTVLKIRDEVHNMGKEVKIFPHQCEYLLQRSMGASKELHNLERGTVPTKCNDNDYIEPLLNSLDRLYICTKTIRNLLQLCGNSEKEHEVALTFSSRPLPGTTDFHISKFALVIRDLEWSLDAFRFLVNNPKAQFANSDSERQIWLSKFLWCESRGRLVYVGVGNDKDTTGSSTVAADNDRQAQDQQNLVLAMESHFTTFQKPTNDVCSLSLLPVTGRKKKLSNSKMVSYMSILRNRLHGDASFDGNSSIKMVPSCFRIPGRQEYKALKLLGKGSYKEVHKCDWLGMNVAIATKLQRNNQSYQGRGDSMIYLEEEAGLLARVQHPNVVTFIGYGYDEENQQGFQVSEIMDSSLRSFLNQGYHFHYPFPILQLIDILLQIVEAMIHIHECGVIYRDLKADNCLANCKAERYGWVVKLTDFGTSELQSLEKGCHFNTPNKGSRRWMAPELYHRPGEEVKFYTWSADVYSFGMTCYEIVTGRVPFEINLFLRWLQEAVREGLRPTIPDNCPNELRELMAKCWAHNPKDRPTFKEIREILWRSKLNHTIFRLGLDGKFTKVAMKQKQGLYGLRRWLC